MNAEFRILVPYSTNSVYGLVFTLTTSCLSFHFYLNNAIFENDNAILKTITLFWNFVFLVFNSILKNSCKVKMAAWSI